MTAKHTPGPWCLSPAGTHVRRTRHGFNICTVNDLLDEEAEGNARIIAAAPELLEALRWCVNEIDMRCEAAIPSVRQALTAARSAIAKAEGR